MIIGSTTVVEVREIELSHPAHTLTSMHQAGLQDFTAHVASGAELSESHVRQIVTALTAESVAPEAKADFLIALAAKGETAGEIAAFAAALRELSIPVPLEASVREHRELLDVCGTGGDRLNTFNISTTVAIVCAAAGVWVVKHGNRAITSKSGSADVLEALGVPIDLAPADAAEQLRRHGFTFLFAPRLHPAFRHIAPARKLCADRGQRTVFNFLGPLLNPARPTAQLLGVARPELTAPLAQTLRSLGLRRAMVASGEVPGHGWLDEVSTLGTNHVAEFYQERGFSTSAWSPADFPLQRAELADLAGGDREANAAIIWQLLRNEDRGPKRDAVLLNSAAALFVAGRVPNLVAGWELAAQLLHDGTAAAKLDALRR
jgi:anthranilate phosphoribosyltransferase